MINVVEIRCLHENCLTRPSFNMPGETKKLYCYEHQLPGMINITIVPHCQHKNCTDTPTHGPINKKSTHCEDHASSTHINTIEYNQCSQCDKEYNYIFDDIKYCCDHYPDNNVFDRIKRICKYCDIKEDSEYVCDRCKTLSNKKEHSIVRYLNKHIDTKFTHDSSQMLQGCSKRRPDVFFDLPKHCVIVEIDEHEHKSYEDSCECSRINEIVNGIGGRSVIFIRYNPDLIKNKNDKILISKSDKIDLLVKTIKKELSNDYDTFTVKLIQLCYSDNYENYSAVKEEDITNLVSI
jgi:hypothetical protein